MMLLGTNNSIGRVYRYGLMTTCFASNPSEDFETDYDVKAAKKFLKNNEDMTEIVDCMFRYNEKYVESMSGKKFKKIAATCILQGIEFDGCDAWNERLTEAKKTFVKSENSDSDIDGVEDEPKEVKKEKSKTSKIKEEFNAPIVVTTVNQTATTEQSQPKEKVVDAKPEDVTEVIEFDTDSKFIPKVTEEKNTGKKKDAIFDFDKMDVDLTASGKPSEKYKKAFNKINDVVKAQKPAGTKYKLTQLPSGLIELQLITDTGNYMGSTMFDPYIVYGNRIFMQANSEVGAVVVPLERYDLINKYLSGYTLTAKDAQECKNMVFFNEDLYAYIDMSEVKEFRKLSINDYRLFGAKLEKILKALQDKMEVLPRFRFKEFQNSNKFTLVSDELVKNPNNYPIPKVKEPVEVKVMGNTIVVSDGSTTSKYKLG